MDREQYTDPERQEGHEEPEAGLDEHAGEGGHNANSQVGQGTSISMDYPVPVDTNASPRSGDTKVPVNQPEYMGLSKPGETTLDGNPGTGFYGTTDDHPGERGVEEPPGE